MKLKEVTIYTDGACSHNPGPGGWAAILFYGDKMTQISGYEPETTNQRMELLAAVKALELLNQPCIVKLYSDSAYLVNCFKQRWIEKWQQTNWLNSQKKPVANRDLWERLWKLAKIHDIDWLKVKGHSDNKWNNQCDKLARTAIINRTSEHRSEGGF